MKNGIWAVIFLICLVMAYSYFYEPNQIVLEDVRIKETALPPDLEQMKFVQFSDLHFEKVGYREKRLRTMINEIHPDVIFFTGDLFNTKKALENPRVVEEALHFLSTLHFKKKFFVVWGEQEYPFRKYLENELEKIHISVLDDKLFPLEVGRSRLNIIGLTEDLKTLDNYYRSNIVEDPGILNHHQGKIIKNNVRRFLSLNRSPMVDKYRAYRFYVGGQYSLKWNNYEVSGRIKLPSNAYDFGVPFYSQLPMGNFNSYFFNLNPKEKVFYLTSIWENNFKGNTISSVRIEDSQWFSFKIEVRSNLERTSIKAKIWLDPEEESENWEIDVTDDSHNRISMGSVGIFVDEKNKSEYLGNIRVRRLNYKAGDRELEEGIEEIPLDERMDEITSEGSLWMTLNDLEKFILKKQADDKFYIMEQKLDRLLKTRDPESMTILLSHRPNMISIAEGKGIGLLLAGHTQGGQINVPFLGRDRFDEYKGEKLDRGLKTFSDTFLYINRGIGMSVVPFRFRSRPELTLIHLSEQ